MDKQSGVTSNKASSESSSLNFAQQNIMVEGNDEEQNIEHENMMYMQALREQMRRETNEISFNTIHEDNQEYELSSFCKS